MDTNPSNNRSCVTNQQQASAGSLTVTKIVHTDGIDTSAITFQAQVSCIPPGGGATLASTLSLNHAGNYTQTVPNLPVGSVCSVVETPPATPPSFPPRCHWVTTYPNGQQATIPAGDTAVQIVNTQTCGPQGANVTVIKTPVIDGKVSYVPGVAFPITATCTPPGGAAVDLSFTASAAAGFHTAAHLVPLGTRCTVHEPAPPVPASPVPSRCHWVTSYRFNGSPASFPVTIASAVSPSNVLEVRNVLECAVLPPPHCDPKTAQADGGACTCLYPGMKPDRRDSTTCVCPQGTLLQPGHGCMPPDALCPAPDGHWNGRQCVTCPDRSQWNDRTKRCIAPPLECRDPMIPNRTGTACVCPDGSAGRHGKCEAREQPSDNPFGHGDLFPRGGTHHGHDDGADNPDTGGHKHPGDKNGANPACVPGVPC
jgi:hypothetical protein